MARIIRFELLTHPVFPIWQQRKADCVLRFNISTFSLIQWCIPLGWGAHFYHSLLEDLISTVSCAFEKALQTRDLRAQKSNPIQLMSTKIEVAHGPLSIWKTNFFSFLIIDIYPVFPLPESLAGRVRSSSFRRLEEYPLGNFEISVCQD